MVVLGHDKATELLAGLLVPDATIIVLKRHHPFQVPAYLGQIVGELASRLRDAQREGAQITRVELPGPEQSTGSDSGVDVVASVVSGIVPASMVRHFPGTPGTGMVSACLVACRVAVTISQVDCAATALAVEGPHGQHQRIQIN